MVAAYSCKSFRNFFQIFQIYCEKILHQFYKIILIMVKFKHLLFLFYFKAVQTAVSVFECVIFCQPECHELKNQFTSNLMTNFQVLLSHKSYHPTCYTCLLCYKTEIKMHLIIYSMLLSAAMRKLKRSTNRLYLTLELILSVLYVT